MNIPIKKQKTFIKKFEKIRPVYIDFAHLLNDILQKAAENLGYLALVQARAKTVVSFSGKIILKDKYKNPLTDMTDLCGARVILHFHSQVEKICEFIKNNFEIDEANSLDLKSMLKVNEFGYRSVHYIVTPKKESILGIAVDEKFRTLKAEIQVRTLAEHVWADISHDRIYKTELTIPEEWKREAAGLSAILENADKTFASMSKAIDSVSSVYELQQETQKAEKDLEKLQTLVEITSKNPEEGAKNVLKLVSVYQALNKQAEAIELLKVWIDKTTDFPFPHARLTFELAMLNLAAHCRDTHSGAYKQEIRLAERTLEGLSGLFAQQQQPSITGQGMLYYRLGILLQNNPEESDKALKIISQAHGLMPENPLCFTALLESILLRNIDTAELTITLFRSSIEKAISDLSELIALGVDKVPACFALGRCHFFLGNQMECIKAYSTAVGVIVNSGYTSSRCVVDAEIDRAGRFKPFRKELAAQIGLYLNIAMSISEYAESGNYKHALEEFQLRKEAMKTPVVIVAGGASRMEETKVEQYEAYIRELMHDFHGTIISGGTTAGIPGLTGLVKAGMQKQGPVPFDLVAYLPENLPKGAERSAAYDHFFETDASDFSTLDILTCWADLITNGIHPKDVILIGIDGGEIAAMEYRIALSLGARVCLVAYSGRAVSDFIQDKIWKDHPNLIQVPNDPHTVWALVNQSAGTVLTPEETNQLAPMVHEFYRGQRLEELNPKAIDVNKFKVLMPWEKLDPALQRSNILQVAFYELLLRRVNLGIRKSERPQVIKIKKTVSPEDYDLLAKLEHARWNAERLLEGWRYGRDKDLVKKLNPYIVPWDQLDDETRKYDYDPVNNIPALLAKIGYEVYAFS